MKKGLSEEEMEQILAKWLLVDVKKVREKLAANNISVDDL